MRSILRSIPLMLLSLFSVILNSCGTRTNDSAAAPSTLIPYLTATQIPASATGPFQTPQGLVTAELPLPSPTPFTYTIQRGDTISSIALKFGVSMDELQAANPEISPNAMSVGQVLKIPSNPENPSGEATPTPAPFTIQQIECYPTADHGMWCFVLAHNDGYDLMENLSVQVSLFDKNKTRLASQTALLPLNILPANTSLPLAVFFPPDIPLDARPQVQVLTAIGLLSNDDRYVPATVHNTLAQIDSDGRSARLSGMVLLPAEGKAARQVWVAGTAYDETGRVVGVRRWESNQAVAAGGTLPFEFGIFSLAGKIARVEFAVEARP